MSDGFVNVSVELRLEGRHPRYFVVMETGDGRRTTSPPFRTMFAANRRAEQLLAEIMHRDPNADVRPGDVAPIPDKASATSLQTLDAEVGHEEVRQ